MLTGRARLPAGLWLHSSPRRATRIVSRVTTSSSLDDEYALVAV
jgi:hypothetical protein